MNLTELLENLSAKNVELWVDGDKLRYRSPENALTPELLGEIKQYKPEIIRILSADSDHAPTYPLSHGQQALWFLYQLAPNSAAYNATYAARLVTNLDIPALKQAAQTLVERHPVLRTTFANIDGELVQTVHENQQVDFSIQEAFDLGQEDVNNWLSETSDRPFDLEQGPMLRFSLLINHTTTGILATKEQILLITAHHIVGDFWSLEIMISELRVLYKAITTGVAAQLPVQNNQYRDYVNWSKQMLSSSEGERLWTYWQQQLSGELPVLNLPTDRPRPQSQTYNGASRFFTLEEKLLQKLTELAKREGASLYTLLLTALQILLLRYTNQEDILIGSPMVNRSRSEFEKIVGYFTNSVVLRADLSGNPTFQELLGRSRSCVLNALDHQEYPFSLLVERLQPVRDPSFSPLYQVALAWDRSHQSDQEVSLMDSDELIVESMIPGAKGAAFDLTLTILEVPGSLKGTWNYNTDLFDGSTIERMTGHFVTILEAIVANPSERISQLPLLTEVEQHQLLVEWNDTHVDYPQDLCIHQLFESQCLITPDAVAVVFENQQLTYHQLNSRANQLAHYLRSLGVGADVLVGICVERSLEMVVGLLGILKAGGAYVPLDPEYPNERLTFMLEDAQVSVLLTQHRLVESLPQHQARVVHLDSDWLLIGEYSQENAIAEVQASNLAYVIYTSGSTGQPKGVMLSHSNLCNHMLWMQATFPLTEKDKVLQKTPFGFDASVWEFYAPLLAGGQLLMAQPGGHNDSAYLLRLIAQQQVTTVQLVPSLLQMLLEQGGIETCHSLKQVFCGGEALPVTLKEDLLSKLNVNLHNLYGPTEACIDATFWNCKQQMYGQFVPIGRPIANTQVYILDQNLQPVAVGVPGELHIGGAGLARGYLNRSELTQEKFIPNPFVGGRGAGGQRGRGETEDQSSNSERLYKTGDLARYLPDGNIEYLGRIDNQVKIRGFRIELGEIEAALSQHPDVQASCVIARVDIPGNKRLVGYIVPNAQITPKVSELRSFLKEKLPDYMVPSVIVILESLPLTPNGKIDRRALPAPELRAGIETSYLAPRNPIEEKLVEIWAQVLRVESIGIHDNFFELGGDSILSIQIITRAKLIGIELTVKQLFANQTIAQLATVAGTTKALFIEQGLVSGTLPLTPIQHWFFEQKLPQKHHFNQSFLLTVPSNLKVEILEQVWQELLKHHDALRLRFSQTDSTWQQIHAAPTDSNIISRLDLSTIPENELETVIETTANELQASLNLEKNLVQVALFWLGINKRARLLIVIHHLVVDGVSWRILLEDLQTGYEQLSQGKAIQLPAKTTSFKNWAQRLTEYAQSDILKSELSYWLSASDSPVASLPLDYADGINTAASVSTVSVSLDEVQTQALLQDVPKAYKTQINDVLLSALGLVLSRWTNNESVLFNLEGHGREDIIDGVDLSRTIGWFTTIFPVVLKLSAIDFDDLGNALKSVKEQLRKIPNKGIGYGLLRYLNVDAEILAKLQTIPTAEISFNYLGQFTQVVNTSSLMQLASESSGQSQSLQGQRSSLLDVNAIITNERLQINWIYSSNIHQQRTIENIAAYFVETLQKLITHCLSPENAGYTPTDFPLVQLNQLELDGVFGRLAFKPELGKTNWQNIEDIYALSPMQEGMLFESLYAPDSGVYFQQVISTFNGRLDVEYFEKAWQQVIEKHSIFRTGFVWESLNQPIQIVYRQVEVSVETVDWRELSAIEQQEQLETFLSAQRLISFQFSQAPLMRLHLLQLDGKTYQFVWSFHHLLLDGWSLPLVFQDLLEFYQAISHGEALPKRPTLGYRNYIAWLQQQNRDLAADFWRQKLQGFTAPTPLTVDKPLSSQKQHSTYSEQQIHLTVSATAAVGSFARQHQLTMSNLVQATWALLLSRYSQEADVVFGATVSGRPPALVGVESMVGLFINTLPVRVQISDDTQLLSLLKDLQTQQVESEQFSYSSLVEIQALSDVPKGTSLFESIVVFENYPVDTAALQGNSSFSVSNVYAIEQTNYPLTVLATTGEQLLLKVSYDTSRFESGTINRMLGHFVTMLSAIVANPSERISQLPMLTESEEEQLLIEWNDTQRDYPQECIHKLFESQVERTPHAVAVVFENQQLTYEELNSRANQLAHYLQSLGVGADVLVGICVERSVEMVVGLLGILKAGGAYVPLDPEYPTERLSFILKDAQLSVLLAQQGLIDKLPEHQGEFVNFDTDWQVISQFSQDNPITVIQTRSLAYVIYTSGSTGQPKGVQISHDAVSNFLSAMQQRPGITKEDILLGITTIAFDIAALEIFLPITVGACLVIARRDATLDGRELLDLLVKSKATIMQATPATWRLLLEANYQSSHLKVLCGGEALPWDLANQLLANSSSLWNLYGPTETTIWSSVCQLDSHQDSLISIGRAIANTQLYILDQNLQPVPIGVPGELHIGGAGLARGYFNRPELTQEKFIPNPLGRSTCAGEQRGRGEERLYKTGDLARYLPDGNIEYLGRIDNQVKIRGFRIELGEIEAVLSQHEHVQVCCAIARVDNPGDKRLVAYIVPQPQQTPKVSELHSFLKEKLPQYMVPSFIVILESLPLTPNGKIDRRALPAPQPSSELSEKYVAPRTPIEEILALIWTQVLKVEVVGIHDNFFTLGGHSLLATQLISRVRTSLKVELPLRSLFAAPTIAQLSQNIQQLQQQDLELSAPPILPRIENAELPLSYAQQRLWFLDQFEPNSAFYNIPAALRLVGTLSFAALEQSLKEIIQRHETLRTNFITIDGKATQVIQTQTNWTVTVVDFKDLSTSSSEIALQELGRQQALQPFDLASDVLIRATLVVLSETEHVLIVCMHHVVSDGWSIGVFVQELTALYNAYSIGQPCLLPPLPIQYADFAIWQRGWLQGEVLQKQLSYWQQQLGDASTFLALPTDRPRPAVQTYHGAYVEFALSVELTQKLTQLSQQQGVTLFMTLLAAYDTLLYRYTGQTDILVGSPIANRDRTEIEGLIGFFVNTLVLRANLDGDRTFQELLPEIREMALGAYAHQDLPFEMLVEALQPERDLSHTPLFQVMFVLQNAPMSQVELSGLTISHLPIESATAKFDLTLTMENTATGLVGAWEYNTDLFDGSTIERMTGHFVTLLEAIVENPKQRISQLPMLTESEERQLLIEWNDTQTDYPRDKCIHQLFEEQCLSTPDAVAVVFQQQQLTYGELNSRANQLAHYLQSLGVSADVLVGICVERSIEMVVGLLGILKAGGAYVPLDPEYPTERLSFMLEDAHVSVLLTQNHLVDKLPHRQAQLVCLDTDWQIISQLSQDNVLSGVLGNNLGYVIYTSGSTGQPKGVAMNQSALCNLILWQVENTTIPGGVKTLQFAPVSFDVSFQEMFSTWCNGGTLVLIGEQLRREPLALLDLLQQQAVERLFVPFVGLQQLAEVAVANESVSSNLREIITAGEQLQITPAICNWLSKLTDCTLHNHYGPSESHVVTSLTLTDSVESWPLLPAIGRPIANTQIYILDEYQKPVPVGVPGELHIGGVALARGYLNRPELTQEKFIPNPFDKSQVTGHLSKLYKTGDLARYLPDGNIEYLGRIDNQVKIRGFRIELGEIEAVLSQYQDVQACCVIARVDTTGDKRLVAYIVPQKQQTPKVTELRSFLKSKLPEYMVPSAIVILESLPLTPSGKVDRRALPAPQPSSESTEKYVAPRTPIEEILALIWTQVLKVEPVGIHDNFFELGGHSLLATQLISRVRTTLKVELPLRSLFAAPTIEELSQNIQRLQQQNLELSAPPILPRVENAELSLSFAQQRLWFLDQFEPNSAFYNIPAALRLVGTLSFAALEQSLKEIIQRHETLRTNFITIDGKATQIIQTQSNWTITVVELKDLSTNSPEIALQQLAQQQALQPFDLASETLIRATLVVLSPTEHVLIVCMHHVVSDGWSMGVFVEELRSLYNAYSIGQPCLLPPLPIQYADFAIWQRQWLQGEVLQSQLDYWQQQLGDAPTFLPLPTDRPRPAVQTFAGAYVEFALSVELTQKLTQLSQQQGVTLFMTLLAAYDTLLYRYTGQTDILVGSPIANRDRSEIEGLIGFFVNTLVLRTDLSGDPSFEELLPQIREMALGAYAHQDLPFEMLVEALHPERDLSHTPLFQVMFALQNAPMSQIELTGLTINRLPIESTTAKFDLTLAMENTATGLVGVWEYNTDLFDSSTIERMTGHFVTMLSAIVANPKERISQLPMLTEVEQHQLLVEWNDTHRDYPQDKCIHQLFEEQVQHTPDAVAVVFKDQQLTYQELNSRANQLAHYLRSLGVGADVLVGICVERSLEMLVGLLGILKAGGAYVPLDPEYPTERLSFMLEDTQLSVLLTQEKLVNKLPASTACVICLDTNSNLINQQTQNNPKTSIKAQDLAYVMYTSGSTGQPKGVSIVHQSVVRLVKQTDYVTFSAKEVFLQVAPISFDAATFEIWGCLLNSGKLVIFPANTPSIDELAQVIEQYLVTTLWLTAGLFHLMVDEKIDALKPLRQLLAGGDILSVSHVHKFRQTVENCQLINGYGPTENTTFTCCYQIPTSLSPDASVPIGRPIANTQVYILDQNLQPVPVGVPGELHIGGAGLARGYLNRPELTQEKFIPNPLGRSTCAGEQRGRGEERLYKTGDLARYLPDGNIEYLGRIDNQVKIRGFRIELGEIEAVLSQHEDVQVCCVIARVDTTGDKRLVAYIVPQPQQTPKVSEVRSFLKSKLPEYMVPAFIVFLESLPLTANGKIDRRALPAPEASSESTEKYVAPRTAIEEILALIWTQVLKVERVGIHDNFFTLGGHSLLATQLISRVRTNLKVELPLRSLFAAPTIAQLSQNIQQLQQQDLELSAPPILPRVENTELPLSFAQQRLWFLDQFEPNSAFYNIPAALRLVGTLSFAALEQSLKEIIQRHETLRTNFITVDGKATQIIQTQTNWKVTVVDLQHLSTSSQELAVEQLTHEQEIQSFDLASETLIRATLVVLSLTEHVLLVCMHHVVSDGWSMGVFVEELRSLYNAYSIGQPSPLLPLPVQYADFAIWQRGWLQGEVLQKQLDYWQQQLGDAPTFLPLPTDRPRPAVQTFAGAYVEFALSVELTQKLTQLSQQQGVTLFMTLLAAYNTLLYRYTGQTDILVGSPIANRDRSEIEGLIGFFVNTLVLRTDLSGDPSFEELLPQIREMALSAYAHQDLPFEMLVEKLQRERDLSHTPLFQVMFALQNAPISQVELTGLSVSSLPIENTTAKFDLTLAMENTATGLVGGWEYNTDLFDNSTIERMKGHFVTMLSAIVANPKQRISKLPILTFVESRQLLVEWNNTQVDYPIDKCIHQLFEEQCLRTPNAVAVVFENQQLTYGELNSRANQLAHYLRSLGVAPDVLVGICVERSVEMVVGLLGILKAGGAYVPLDPEYPQDRLHFMLEDTQVSLLLTQQHLVDRLPQHQAQVVCLEQVWKEILQNKQDNLTGVATAFNLANVIYTSGSTGKPKGVMVEHRGLCNLAQAQIQTFGLTSDSRILQFASFSFDASISEVLMAFGSGARLYLGTKDSLMPGTPLIARLSDYGITHITLPPSAVAVLPVEKLPALQTIIVAGEACTVELMRQWSAVRNFFNAYGPTEASVCATIAKCTPNDQKVSIGRPIANTQVYILDQNLQPVPVGVAGELHIGGAGLARGYLNRPDLTQEKFIPNPFVGGRGAGGQRGRGETEDQSSNSERLYKTGDLARYLPDGSIEYLGRIDNQVKIRGFRIELGEIEAALSQHEDVQASCVIARVDIPGNKRLVGYIVPKPQQTPTISVVRSYLKEKLPDYMVPSVIVILESLPLTPNGKIDRRALPEPESRAGIETTLVAPRTAIEEKLAEIWAQVLRVESIGIDDNFFELGGDSILSIQIITRAKLAGIELTVKQLFANQTIAQLATVAGTTKALFIEQGLVTGTSPLTPIQQWFFEQNLPEKHHFNQSFLLSVPSDLKIEILEQVWQQLLRHHDALRLRFSQTDGFWQAVHTAPTDEISIERFDLSTVEETEVEKTIESTANELQASLNLSENLVQVALFWLGINKRARLLIVIHHLVVDGVSWRILLEDLQTLYEQLIQGQTIQLPAKTTSFKDWAQRLTEYAQSDILKSELSYWLRGCERSISPLPVDYPQGVNTAASVSRVSVSLDEAQTQALLQDVPKAYKTQINDVLLTALGLVLSRWTNSESVLFNLEGHGREDIIDGVDLSRTIGWFTTIFPVFVQLSVTDDLGNVLKSVKEQLRAIPNKGIGYGLLRYLNAQPEILAQLQTIPASEISFNYLGQFTQVVNTSSLVQLADESSGESQSLQGQRSSLLDVNAIIANERLQIHWTYSTHIHQQTTIENIAAYFVETLQEIIAHCLSPENAGYTPTDFPLIQLNQLELDQILANL
ncbi:Non-ribosomal peptide synthetase [Desmonostoc muscorum LEGE 12446]|nr:non-ribosomal peptide synthase/polyketide synthase [Desmonostoc muscorum]MCF2150416.1 Non-ribosomal peptide synthetase [Desmonostoc muscorum LEGE 12446]